MVTFGEKKIYVIDEGGKDRFQMLLGNLIDCKYHVMSA